ncbi:MAG: OmpA family protein [Bacteroidota bacterium]|nr:OmpA family protein [Bacteroidota bacterium]
MDKAKKKLFIFFFIIGSFLPGIVLSQDLPLSDDGQYLWAPDTIVFVSEQNVNYTDEPSEFLMFHLNVVEEESGLPVPARLKIYNRGKKKLLSVAREDKHKYHASLVSNEEYIVEVSAPGFVDYSETFRPVAQNGNKDLNKILKMEKSNFTIDLQAINKENGEIVKHAAITLVNITSNKTIHTLVNPATGACKAEFDLTNDYKIEVHANGFIPYQEEYTSNKKLIAKEFKLSPIEKLQSFKVKVVENGSNKSIQAEVKITDGENKKIPHDWKKQYFEANLAPGKPYKVIANAEGYNSYEGEHIFDPQNETVIFLTKNLPDKVNEVIEDIEGPKGEDYFVDVEIGKSIVLENIVFEQSKYILKESSYESLYILLEYLKKNPQYKVVISGHTDNQGEKNLNQLLSQNRAKVIANFLIEHEIEEDKLTFIGHGSAQPIAPNDTEENRAKNRRVEITLK